jgi:hypothetical protein
MIVATINQHSKSPHHPKNIHKISPYKPVKYSINRAAMYQYFCVVLGKAASKTQQLTDLNTYINNMPTTNQYQTHLNEHSTYATTAIQKTLDVPIFICDRSYMTLFIMELERG